MKDIEFQTQRQIKVSQKSFLPKLLGSLLGFATIAFCVYSSIDQNTTDDSSTILFKKSHYTFNKIQKDETSEFPHYSIKLKFVTQHGAPVRNCLVNITIDGDVFQKQHDANGIVTLNGSFKKMVTEEKFPINVVITAGVDENILTNKVDLQLVKSTTDSNLYQLDEQVVYKPNMPKEAHVMGRVVNQKGQPIEQAKLTITIFFPVFQDQIIAYTDIDGKFDVLMLLEQLDPLYGDLTIEADGYMPWNIKKDMEEYKDGFYLINHLQFEFKQDIVLKVGEANLVISGVVQEHKTSQPYSGATVSMDCESTKNPSHKKTFQIGVTGEDGKFSFSNNTEFKVEETIVCTVISKPKEGSDLYPGKKVFNFLLDENFKKQNVVLYVTTKPMNGYIKGKFVNDVTGQPVPDLKVKYVGTSTPNIDVEPIKTNDKGEFQFDVVGYESETQYEGYLVVDSEQFDTSIQYPQTLKEENSYKVDAGVLKAKQKPKPVKIQVTGVIQENTLKTPLPDYELTISITHADNKVDKIETKTNAEGKFLYEFDGLNTENYTIELYGKPSEKFQELKETRELGYSKPSKFDADFDTVFVKRVQTYGKITGYLYDASTKKPMESGKLTVVADIPFPEQEFKCVLEKTGNFVCDFIVEKYLTYKASIQIATDYGLTGKSYVGELTMENKYTILGAKLGVKFEIIPKKGIISGTVVNGGTDQVINEGYYKILSIDPSVENQDSLINKKTPYRMDGTFEIVLDLHVGPKYIVKVLFTSPALIETESIFVLDYKNKYVLRDQKILLGLPLNGFIEGHIKSKTFYPVAGALVKVNLDNVPTTFSTLTDSSGYYKVRVPASTAQESVNAKFAVEKLRYKDHIENIQFEKKLDYQILNHDIILTGVSFKSVFSGKLIDEKEQPVPFCSLSLLLKDSFKEPTTNLPYTTVSLINGQYVFDIDVDYNDVYIGYFTIKCNYFIDRVEIIEFNSQNDYRIQNRVSRLQRLAVTIDFEGTVLNSLNLPVPEVSIKLSFDYDSHQHGVEDMEGGQLEGKFDFKHKALMGYVYKAKAEFILPQSLTDDYQDFFIYLEFSPSNNYKIHKDYEIRKKEINCLISGEVFDSDNQPLSNVFVILRFTQKQFSKESIFGYTNEKGQFQIEGDVQQGYEYDTKVEGRKTGYKDNSVMINLNQKNKFTVFGIQIFLTKADQSEYTQGFIHGHGLSITGEPLPNSEVVAYSEVEPSKKYTTTTEANGRFMLPDLVLIKGNVYSFVLNFTPSDPNFKQKRRKIYLSVNDHYEYDDLTLAVERKRVNYTITGKITDKNSGQALGESQVIATFTNQLLIQNSIAYTNQDGDFTLTGSVAKGLNYDGKFVVKHAGYETLTPKFTLNYNKADDEATNYVKNDANFILVYNPFQQQYYLDEINTIPIRSKVFEKTTCKLFPQRYLPFVKVSLYLEQDGILIAETYTNLKGEFVIYSPRPIFSEIKSHLVFEREGYDQLKENLTITPKAQLLEQAPKEITNKKGISDCSKKQRKIQDKFEKT